MHHEEQEVYVQAVLNLYRRLPGTPERSRRADRHLATTLHRRGVRLDVVEIAMRLATARRNARPTDVDPLPPIRSLHYFLPLIDELPQGPPPDGYLDYLRDVVPDKQSATRSVTSTNARRPTRPRRCTPRQLRLQLSHGACPENDASS
jgi:hypothetical protein